MSQAAGVYIEFLDDGEIGGVVTNDQPDTLELWVEESAVGTALDVQEFLEFHDGRGPAGPPGPAGGESLTRQYVVEEPLSSWSFPVPEGMTRRPSVTVYVDDEQVEADVTVTTTMIAVSFPAPTSGVAVIT